MLKLRRTRPAEADDAEEPGGVDEAPLPQDDEEDEVEEPVRGRMSPIGVGLRVTALVVVGIVMIAVLALVGDARLADIVQQSHAERSAMEKDRAELSAAIAAAERAEAASSAALGGYIRAMAAAIAGAAGAAAADNADKALTELAQSMEPLEAASRGFALAVARSVFLDPREVEGIDPQAEGAFIQRNRDRAAQALRVAREMPASLAELVLENQAVGTAARGGNASEARERYVARAAPKAEALQQQLATIRTTLQDFSADLGARHGALAQAIGANADSSYEDQRSSIRLQIILLVVVLTAGAIFIALYGLAMPLADLAEAATRFADGQYDAPVSVLGRRDEIGRLSSALEQLREGQADVQRAREEHLNEQREAERLSRVQLEREVQQLRRDRDRLERERVERDQMAAAGGPPAEAVAQARAELEAETGRRIAELEETHRRRLADAEASAQHEARQREAEQRELLGKAEAELNRLKAELAKAAAPQPEAAVEHEAVAKLEAELARLKQDREAERKRFDEGLAAARANAEKARAEAAELASRQTSSELEKEVARLREELDKAQKAQVATVVGERELARLRAEFDNERAQLTKAAQDAHRRATAADQALRAASAQSDELKRLHASQLELERQQRADELASQRATMERAANETQRRLTEQFGDRLRVLNALANDFEAAIGTAVDAVQSASAEVRTSGARISETAARSGQRSEEISQRAGRAGASIRAAVSAAEQLATALSDMSRQASQAARGTGGAIEAARAAGTAMQTMALAAKRMGEASQVITDLAERANLLALNAAIEAARAGEGGAGFSVLAAEVKSLANRAGRASKDISERMAEVLRSIGDATGTLGGVGTTLNDLDASAGAVARAVDAQGSQARAVVLGVHAAAEGTEGIGRSVGDVTAAVEEASRAALRLQGAADALAKSAGDLRKQVEDFLTAIRAA